MRVWELGYGRAPWYQAMLMLAPAFPERTFDELAGLSIGERNTRLVALRVRMFGSAVEAVVACPRCHVALEFGFDLLELCPPASDPEASHAVPFEVAVGELCVRCRPATTADVAALPNGETSGTALADRLVVAVVDGDAVRAPMPVDDVVATSIVAALEDADPFSHVPMSFACAACGHEWSSPYDIVTYLWSEITAQVHRILEDVRLLAKTYGWAEGSILTMSGIRRRYYLDRAV